MTGHFSWHGILDHAHAVRRVRHTRRVARCNARVQYITSSVELVVAVIVVAFVRVTQFHTGFSELIFVGTARYAKEIQQHGLLRIALLHSCRIDVLAN
jgi:hypothetical protein